MLTEVLYGVGLVVFWLGVWYLVGRKPVPYDYHDPNQRYKS